jgi:integrase
MLGKHLGSNAEPISRPARIEPEGIITVATVMDEYLKDMLLKQDSLDTQRKLTRWAKQFLNVMGDMELDEIKPKHGYEYIRNVLEEHPDRSNKTLKDYLWGVQNLLKFCVEMGYININPFRDLDLRNYGGKSKETYRYSMEELRNIFAYDWKPQERLLLSILATTGMRPSEAGNMTWERFNDTEHKGIRFFTTLDTETEQVQVKNLSSKRQVPLHPDLILPQKSKGRLFNYVKDDGGKCSTDINYVVNPTLHALVPHPYKSVRSFRRTFKNMMSDKGVSEEVHDAITGHGENKTASRKHYGGGGFVQRFEAISKLDISFLDPA